VVRHNFFETPRSDWSVRRSARPVLCVHCWGIKGDPPSFLRRDPSPRDLKWLMPEHMNKSLQTTVIFLGLWSFWGSEKFAGFSLEVLWMPGTN
ncbi:hypothetical protein, partial [Thiolapillus sp.]|uniref:hypothetical protein n=1 Tax=Thiolapillus sp. TaxID=2017437 RepID=UPI003AF941CD